MIEEEADLTNIDNDDKNEAVVEEDMSEEEVKYEEDEEENEEKDRPRGPTWSELKFIPNKKRFIILSVLFSVLELAGLLILAYAFVGEDYPDGLFDFGIFIITPFIGVAVSYLVENRKEAVGISAINAGSSITISLIIYILVEYYLAFPAVFEFNIIEHLAIPALFIVIQITVAFTLTRFRRMFRRVDDASYMRERDKAMIEELRASRIARGLEPDPTAESDEELIEEKIDSLEEEDKTSSE